MRGTIVAFSGWKRSGKSTAAELLANSLGYNKSVTYSCAEPIKKIIEMMYGIKESDVEDKEAIISSTKKFHRNGCSYRQLCILIGEGMKSALSNSKIWVRVMERRIRNSNDKVVIIPDIRYRVELNMLKRLRKDGFKVHHVLMLRKESVPEWALHGLSPVNDVERKIIEDDFEVNPSELEWCSANPVFDMIVKNDNDMMYLKGQMKKLAERVRSGR